jgi:phenylalanyl-tRNA synthetase beta chain
VIEEILRIHGFNNVTLPEILGASYLAEYAADNPQPWLEKISRVLTGKGWYEIMTNSLTRPEYVIMDKSLDPEDNIEIINKLSEDLGVLKQSMLFTGLESVVHNLNRKQANLKFFEFGRTYHNRKDKYLEANHLSLLMVGKSPQEDWRNISRDSDFYDLIATVNTIINSVSNLHLEFETNPSSNSVIEHGVAMMHKGKQVAAVGQVRTSILKNFEIKSKVFYADLDWDLLLKFTSHNIVFEEMSKFPRVKRDLSLVLDKKILFSEIEAISKETEPELIKEIRVFDVYEGNRIESGKKAYAITFTLQDKEKTLTDKIIDKTMSKLMKAFENKTGALIRQ